MTEHEHPSLVVLTASRPDGTPVDVSAASELLGAALAGCKPCWEARMPVVAEEPDSVALLAVTAFLSLEESFGQAGPLEGVFPVPGSFCYPSRQVFTQLFADDSVEALRFLQEMDGYSRRTVLSDVLDVLVTVHQG